MLDSDIGDFLKHTVIEMCMKDKKNNFLIQDLFGSLKCKDFGYFKNLEQLK